MADLTSPAQDQVNLEASPSCPLVINYTLVTLTLIPFPTSHSIGFTQTFSELTQVAPGTKKVLSVCLLNYRENLVLAGLRQCGFILSEKLHKIVYNWL